MVSEGRVGGVAREWEEAGWGEGKGGGMGWSEGGEGRQIIWKEWGWGGDVVKDKKGEETVREGWVETKRMPCKKLVFFVPRFDGSNLASFHFFHVYNLIYSRQFCYLH